jgi:hypothetical protein
MVSLVARSGRASGEVDRSVKDERVNCMACLVVDDDMVAPGVATIDGITHALAALGVMRSRHYALCDFDDNDVLLPGAYYRRLVEPDRISWTPSSVCLLGKHD